MKPGRMRGGSDVFLTLVTLVYDKTYLAIVVHRKYSKWKGVFLVSRHLVILNDG